MYNQRRKNRKKAPGLFDKKDETISAQSPGQMATITTAELFNEEAFSDITVKFGDYYVKAHKIVLCAKSEYFKKAVGPESCFKESKQDILELHDDDSQAVGAMLKYLYTESYTPDAFPSTSSARPTWEQHLNTAIVADKYGITVLKSTAFDKFKEKATSFSQTDDIIKLIQRSSEYPDSNDELQDLIERLVDTNFAALFRAKNFEPILEADPERKHQLCVKHFDKLIDTPEFRSMVQTDSELSIKLLDAFKVSKQLVEQDFVECQHCKHVDFYDVVTNPVESRTCTRPVDNIFGHGKCGSSNMVVLKRVWVQPSTFESS